MSDIRWEGYSHDEIYARVQQGPGRLASADAEAAWSTVESTIRAVDAQLTRAVRQIGAGWQGRAADAVHGGMTVMSNWALDAAGDATLTRNGITAQADQAARLRTAMPPPHTAEWNRMVHEEIPAVGLMSATGDLGALEERMANDHAVAVDMMNRYSSQSSDNQRMMNYWTQPPTVVVEAVAPGSSTGSVGAVAAATAVRPGAARAAPTLGTAGGRDGGRDGGVAPAVPDPAAAGAEGSASGSGTAMGPGAAPATVGAGSTPGRSGSSVPAAVPTSAAARPGTTGRAGSPPSGSASGRPGGVGRPPTPSTPTPRGSLPGSSGGYVDAPGGVRPIVPGPPPAGGAADWRTGLRTAPVEPPGGLPRPAVPGTVGGEPTPRPAAIPADERAPASRTGSGHGFFPMAGAARPADQEHRRPSYLVDDTDVFADDRWFAPPVIGGDAQMSRA